MKYSPPLAAAFALAYSTLVLADGDNCIKFTGDKSYTWSADGSFSGSGNIDDQQHCFGTGSGGFSFGAPGAPSGQAGNTRLECYFPENPTAADFFNCNLSLIDGFSAAVTCETAGGGWPNSNNDSAPLGCGFDLMSGCPDNLKDDTCKCCKNTNGGSATDLSAVAPVFQSCKNSDTWPNTAELYFSMKGAFEFQPSDFPLTCKVGKGTEPASSQMVRREAEAQAHQHVAGHRQRNPMHARHVHARGLMDVMS